MPGIGPRDTDEKRVRGAAARDAAIADVSDASAEANDASDISEKNSSDEVELREERRLDEIERTDAPDAGGTQTLLRQMPDGQS